MDSILSTDASTLNDSISYQNIINGLRSGMIRHNLPPESLSKYYEERKKIIFYKKDVKSNENLYLNLLKQSQLVVNEKFSNCLKFFTIPEDIYNLSVALKENIANYSLIFSLYFIEGENLNAYKLFLLMCEQNKSSIKYLTLKIIQNIPRMTKANKIGLFFPSVTKIMLQILSIFIKLSGKFSNPTLEKQYIILYFKIIHILSFTFKKYILGYNSEIIHQLENERRYLYASFLFDSSLYLFKRYQPLSTIIDILQHILELYENNLTFLPDEIVSILLLKVSFNLGLFFYVNGNNNESINNLIQARKILLDIKDFPKSTFENANFTFIREENNMLYESSNINNYDFNSNINITRSKNERTSLNSYGYGDRNEKKVIDKLKERTSKSDREYGNKNLSPKYLSNIYLGANSLLIFKNPILLDQVKEKILVEIELLLSEIELNQKNYKESFKHINTILNMNSLSICINYMQNNINNNKTHLFDNTKLTNYVLTNSDKNRMMFILGKIESANNRK